LPPASEDVDADFVFEEIEESPTVDKVLDLGDIIALLHNTPLWRVNALELNFCQPNTPKTDNNDNDFEYLTTPTISHQIKNPSDKIIKILVKEVKELKKDNVDFKNQVNGMKDKLDRLINLIAGTKNKLKACNNTTILYLL